MAMYDPVNASSSSSQDLIGGYVDSMEEYYCSSPCLDISGPYVPGKGFPSNPRRHVMKETAKEITHEDKLLFDMTRRAGLRRSVNGFRRRYSYTKEGTERKTCIWPGGQTSWHGRSSGIMWVGVYGTDSICVVTRDHKIQDKKNRSIRSRGSGFFTDVRRAAISDILDLGDPATYCALRQKHCKGIEKPFGVVSVIPLTDVAGKRKRHEVSDDGYAEDLDWLHLQLCTLKIPPTDDKVATTATYDIQWDMGLAIIDKFLLTTSKVEHAERNAIDFLRRKMRSKKEFTLNETIQTAISAFQKLFKKKFNANEIQVSVIDPNYGVTAEEIKYKDEYVKELDTSEIAEHLAVINEHKVSARKKKELTSRQHVYSLQEGTCVSHVLENVGAGSDSGCRSDKC